MVTGKEEFQRMNIMAGTARSLERKPLSDSDRKTWDRDFNLLVEDLSKLVDEDLGKDLAAEKDWYTSANEVAKGYFEDIPFGGLKCATGEYGFSLLWPQHLKTSASDTTAHKFYSWIQKITTTAAKTYADIISASAFASNQANKKSVICFHRLVSYKPAPRLLGLRFKVNDYPYVPYTVEPFSKVGKNNKLLKLIPMAGRVLLHPGGKFELLGYFDLEQGSTTPSGTTDIDIEIAPFGLVFAQYDFLAETEWT